jgi:hypothetical protein
MASRSQASKRGAIARAMLCACFAATISLASVGSGQAQQTKLIVPSEPQLVIMIKATLLAFNDANATGNYTVLRDLASPEFQQQNTPAQLGDAFRAQRAEDVDLSPVVALQPTLWRPAAIDPQGLLHVDGYFASRPKQVSFALVFKEVAGRWRLHGLGTQLGEPGVAQNEAAGRRTTGAASPAEQVAQRISPIQRFGGPQARPGYRGWANPADLRGE